MCIGCLFVEAMNRMRSFAKDPPRSFRNIKPNEWMARDKIFNFWQSSAMQEATGNTLIFRLHSAYT